MTRRAIASVLAITVSLGGCGCGSEARHAPAARDASPREGNAASSRAAAAPWWHDAVFYEIYPRSFYDTNGDGIGDLRGIERKLDYLADLGIGALWITPFFPSPQVDFGYDVSDYEQVDPQFGTLADFDRLVAEAHRRQIRVVVDLVLNHTSDRHAWFVDARSSRTSPRRSFYVWRDPARGGGPPNNWASIFEPSAWTLDRATGQYYYHAFYAEQPDLDWRNPEVERAMLHSVRFWLDRGVDGFRLDAIAHVYEDVSMHDNPVLPALREGSRTEHAQEHRYTMFQPETHALLRRLRQVLDGYGGDRLLIGEAYTSTAAGLVPYYGDADNEVQLPFNFLLMGVDALDARRFRAKVDETERALGGRWTNWVLDNHDNRRSIDRYGDGSHDDAIAKLLALMLLTLRGSPFLYYGQEIGMATTEPRTLAEVRDPVGRRYWPGNKGRDGERTPMQWDATPNAGFTSGEPWLRVPESAARRSVALEQADAGSILSLVRRVLALRRASVALRRGAYTAIDTDPRVFAYRRTAGGESRIVALNTSAERVPIELGLAPGARVVVSTLRPQSEPPRAARALALEPFEGVVLEAGGRAP